MPMEVRVVRPGRQAGEVISDGGEVKRVPHNWALLLPGDAALTRRVKRAGPHWQMQEKRGRKLFSKGVWAPKETLASLRRELETERACPSYQKRLIAGRARRQRCQEVYVETFQGAVLAFLAFHLRYRGLAHAMAQAVTEHAVPVGSGTVARTNRISLEARAEAAVIAWMRHHTTAYDTLTIARIKGERRKIRRKLAQESLDLLGRYRNGESQGTGVLERVLGYEKAGG